jgi:hypothetical protein
MPCPQCGEEICEGSPEQHANALKRTGTKYKCPICNKPLVSPVTLGCGHLFCFGCVNKCAPNYSPFSHYPFRYRPRPPPPAQPVILVPPPPLWTMAPPSMVAVAPPIPAPLDGYDTTWAYMVTPDGVPFWIFTELRRCVWSSMFEFFESCVQTL